MYVVFTATAAHCLSSIQLLSPVLWALRKTDSKSNHKLCIVEDYISLPRGSCLPPPPPLPPCFLPRIPHPLVHPSRHASLGHLRGDMCTPLPGDSLQGDVGSLRSWRKSEKRGRCYGLGFPQRGTPLGWFLLEHNIVPSSNWEGTKGRGH